MAYSIRAAARIYGLVKGTANTTLKQAVSPRTDSPSLTHLGAPLVSGFGRRPIWLSTRTPEVVACNVWRARREERQVTEQQDRTCRGRLFARGWQIDYRGYPAEDRWTSEAERRLRQKVEEERKKRQLMPGPANNPHAKRIKDVICDLCWTRFAQLPDPSHDDAQGNPMMLCLKCYQERGRDRGHRQDKRDSSSTAATAPLTVSTTAAPSLAERAPTTAIAPTTSSPFATPTTFLTAPTTKAEGERDLRPEGFKRRRMENGPGQQAVDVQAGAGGTRSGSSTCDVTTTSCHGDVAPTSVSHHRGSKRHDANDAACDLSSKGKVRKVNGCDYDIGPLDIPLPTITRAQKAEGQPKAGEPAGEFAKSHATGGGDSVADFGLECKRIDAACDEEQCHPGAASSGDNVTRCPTCEGVHKPVRFRRVPDGAMWRGAMPGTMVCTRCHLQLRWGHP